MASLDVESLFTNIPLEETINISCDFLFGSATKIETILKNGQTNRLNVAMGSPLGPNLANASLFL